MLIRLCNYLNVRKISKFTITSRSYSDIYILWVVIFKNFSITRDLT